MADTTINPDEQPIFDALLEAGVGPAAAYTAVRRVRELAAHNITTLIEAKLDAQNAKIDALRWVIGIGFVGLGILIAVLRILG